MSQRPQLSMEAARMVALTDFNLRVGDYARIPVALLSQDLRCPKCEDKALGTPVAPWACTSGCCWRSVGSAAGRADNRRRDERASPARR